MAPPLLASLSTAKKLGIIVPSSNTAVETLTISILNSLQANIIPIFTRIRVLTLGTDASTKSQFTPETLCTAAQLLADAGADAILWNGTSGMFVGGDLEADRQLAKAMSDAMGGVPCSTTTIATIEALKHFGIKDVSIAVPYTPELTAKVDNFFTNEGYQVHKALCMAESPAANLDIAKCTDESIKEVVRKSVTPETKAVLVACTNWPGTPLAAELEEELKGVMIIDSIAVTAWMGLRMIGFKGANENIKEWGKLLALL